MISVRAEYDSSHLVDLLVTGHGGEEKGYDIYCAGVSTCLIGALNALDNAENYKIEVRSGYTHLIATTLSTTHDEIVLETLLVQLKTLADSYPEHCKVVEISRKEGTK
jgi:uncharacterized protein YsxB (DUF464 family)